MKKNFMWTMAALFVSGLAFTSCQVVDNPNPYPEQGNVEDLFDKTTSVIDFEDDQTPFVNDSRMATVGVGTVEGWDSKVAILKSAGNAQNGYSFADYDFTEKVKKAAISIVTFDMYNNQGSRSIVTIGDALVRTNGVGAGCAKMAYGAKGAIFRIGSDKNNAFINGTNYAQADLCNKWLKVEGKVYNSVIGPGGQIGKGTVVSHSIIMNETQIGDNCNIEKAIIAERAQIGSGVTLGAFEEKENETKPGIYCEGLCTIGERSVIPDNVKVGKNTMISGVTTEADYPDRVLGSGRTLDKAGDR